MATDTVNQVLPTGWRAKAAAMLVEARQLIAGAMHASEGGDTSYRLLQRADDFADTMQQAVMTLEAGDEREAASLLLGDVYDLCAMLSGASAVDGATMAAQRLITDAVALCGEASNYLDGVQPAQGAHGGGSAQPSPNAVKASPAPVWQAAGAFPRDPVRMLWQFVMDELCNANPKDCEEEITKCIALMDGLKPYLEGSAHAREPEGAACASGGNVLDAERGERADICCKAADEIFSLAALVSGQIAQDAGASALRSMLRRVQTLSNCILSAADDAVDTVAQIRDRMEAI
jgi:hypothetical protein